MKKKILVIQHHGKFGGASKSISEFILNLKKKFDIDILCPEGTTFSFFKKKKIRSTYLYGIPKFDITEIGYYSGLRKILILREIFFLPIFIYKILKLTKKKYDIIHLNDSSLIIIAPILSYFSDAKIICHIRTRIDKSKLSKLFYLISKKYIKKFICIDETTFSTSIDKSKSIIIYNIFDLRKNSKIKKKVKNKINIGFLGTLDFHKGLDFLFDCISHINLKKNNLNFIIGGSLSVNNKIMLKILEIFRIKKNFSKILIDFKKKKFHNVKFTGPINNLNKYYKNIDIMCFPSRMNALGRPVLEAASFKIPSIVCLKDKFNDTIKHNHSGYVIKFGDKKRMTRLLISLGKKNKEIKRLGDNAKKNFIRNHNIYTNLKKLSVLYKNL